MGGGGGGPGRLFPDPLTSQLLLWFFSWDCARRAVRSYDKILQPPSLSSKDVERFRVAASQPQVTITGQ